MTTNKARPVSQPQAGVVTLDESLRIIEQLKLQKNKLLDDLGKVQKDLRIAQDEIKELKASVTGNVVFPETETKPVTDPLRFSDYAELVRTLHQNGNLKTDIAGDRYALREQVLASSTKEELAFWADLGLVRRDKQHNMLIGRRIDGILTRVYVFNGTAAAAILEGYDNA